MFELILITSALLVIFDKKMTNHYFVLAVRLLQILVSSYCLYSNNLGGIANSIESETSSTLLYLFSVIMISYDLEIQKYKRFVKEGIFFLTSVFLVTNLLSISLITTLLIMVLFLYNRRAYFIDYMSIFLISVIALIYFSELASTVLTTKDAYYLYLTSFSEIIFYPLILLFVVVEIARQWGIKRNIRVVLVLIPILLGYKFKFANNVDNSLLYFLALVLLVAIILNGRKVLQSKSLRISTNFLYSISLFTVFTNLIMKQYELAIVSSLTLSLILIIYRLIHREFSEDKSIKSVATSFVLVNFACLPVSFSGLSSLDALGTGVGSLIYGFIVVSMLISILTFCLIIKFNGDHLYINLLESSNKLKMFTVSLFSISLVLMFMNMSPFLVEGKNAHKLIQLIFDTEVETLKEALLGYNLSFIIFLIITIVIGYFVKVVNENIAWRASFTTNEFLKNISFSKYKYKVIKKSENALSNTKIDERSEIELSSFNVSFFILTFFLIISLIIIEL